MLGISGVLEYMTDNLRSLLEKIDFEVANKICEIRIRRNQPLILVIRNTSYFLDESGDVYNCPAHNIVYVDSDEFDKLFLRLCDYSLYSNSENLKNGFITYTNTARVCQLQQRCSQLSLYKRLSEYHCRRAGKFRQNNAFARYIARTEQWF